MSHLNIANVALIRFTVYRTFFILFSSGKDPTHRPLHTHFTARNISVDRTSLTHFERSKPCKHQNESANGRYPAHLCTTLIGNIQRTHSNKSVQFSILCWTVPFVSSKLKCLSCAFDQNRTWRPAVQKALNQKQKQQIQDSTLHCHATRASFQTYASVCGLWQKTENQTYGCCLANANVTTSVIKKITLKFILRNNLTSELLKWSHLCMQPVVQLALTHSRELNLSNAPPRLQLSWPNASLDAWDASNLMFT